MSHRVGVYEWDIPRRLHPPREPLVVVFLDYAPLQRPAVTVLRAPCWLVANRTKRSSRLDCQRT